MQSREEIRASTQTHVNFRLLHVAIHTTCRALYNKECNHMSISTTPSQLMINNTHSQSQSLRYTVPWDNQTQREHTWLINGERRRDGFYTYGDTVLPALSTDTRAHNKRSTLPKVWFS